VSRLRFRALQCSASRSLGSAQFFAHWRTSRGRCVANALTGRFYALPDHISMPRSGPLQTTTRPPAASSAITSLAGEPRRLASTEAGLTRTISWTRPV